MAFDNYEREEDDGEAFEYKELDLEALAAEAQEVKKQSVECANGNLIIFL